MAFKNKPFDDLMLILQAGGGLHFEGKDLPKENLVQLADAAKKGRARLILSVMSSRTSEDLISIAVAGGGHVIFED